MTDGSTAGLALMVRGPRLLAARLRILRVYVAMWFVVPRAEGRRAPKKRTPTTQPHTLTHNTQTLMKQGKSGVATPNHKQPQNVHKPTEMYGHTSLPPGVPSPYHRGVVVSVEALGDCVLVFQGF